MKRIRMTPARRRRERKIFRGLVKAGREAMRREAMSTKVVMHEGMSTKVYTGHEARVTSH